MPVALYMDVHVPQAITIQLRHRDVNVVTAIEDGRADVADADLLERARELGSVTFTQDIRFQVLAQDWQRENRPFAGLVFGHQLGGTIGQYVHDLELIAKLSEPHEWESVVERLPF